ncbi:MAG: hypothetical protein H0U74_03270 [Bradymonadaceae bacterium]|nr:hypothetical protein [Lujinxingiaceae bacterium]
MGHSHFSTGSQGGEGCTIRLIWYNTFLLHGIELNARMVSDLVAMGAPTLTPALGTLAALGEKLSLGPRSRLRVGAKPSTRQRASELGARLGELHRAQGAEVMVAALGEVFCPQLLDTIRDGLDETGVLGASGPGAGMGGAGLGGAGNEPPRWMQSLAAAASDELPMSSGLRTLSVGRPISRVVAEPFHLTRAAHDGSALTLLNRGHPIRDPDFWANKGVLLTEIDLGFGGIELYTTHLFSGQVIGEALWLGLQRLTRRRPWLAGTLARALQNPVAARLLDRFEAQRHFFSLPKKKRLLVQRAQLRQLNEFICRHHRAQNVVVVAGDFNLNWHDASARALLADTLDQLAGAGIVLDDVWAGARANDSSLVTMIEPACLFEYEQSQASTPEWLDYVFIERETEAHEATLAIASQQLRHFARQPGSEGMRFLSDHIGLEVMLRAAPRRP